jgi:hypothetical protein
MTISWGSPSPNDGGDRRPRGNRSWALALVIAAATIGVPLLGVALLALGERLGKPDYVSFDQLESEPILRDLPPGSSDIETTRSTSEDLPGGLPLRSVAKTFRTYLTREEIVKWYRARFPTRYALARGGAPPLALDGVGALPYMFEGAAAPRIRVAIVTRLTQGARGARPDQEVSVVVEVI